MGHAKPRYVNQIKQFVQIKQSDREMVRSEHSIPQEIQQLQHQIKAMGNEKEDLVSEVETLRHNQEVCSN